MTTGWRPTCSCGLTKAVPAVVLDPFGGSGVTNLVAFRLGRDSIYIDIKPEYLQMAKKRLMRWRIKNMKDKKKLKRSRLKKGVSQVGSV